MARTDAATPAEQITALLRELHDEVTTREKVPRYKKIRRSADRTTAILEWADHVTKGPGLLAQLSVVAGRRDQARVEIRRWVLNATDPENPSKCARGCKGLCSHGRWIPIRVETREITGSLTPGAAFPGGSPGWDEDGALAPLVGGSSDPGEPLSEAWHVRELIYAGLADLGRSLHAQGWRPPATLIDIALENEETGQQIADRLRRLVSQARTAAEYDTRSIRLRDTHCCYCWGQLRFRNDADSDAWCAGHPSRPEGEVYEGPVQAGEEWPPKPRQCGARWSRYDYVKILAGMQTPAERTEERQAS